MGFEGHDDAGVVRLDGNDALIQTVDFFTPIVDDPYDFGQIAAANSLSDIYAMGGKPFFALNIAAFPVDEFPTELMAKILRGGQDKAREAGISIIGGHTIDDPEPKYGLVVTGTVHIDRLVRNSTARPGDILILTKPLGSGIISTAIKRGVAEDQLIREVTDIMTTLNVRAAELMREYGVNAATDVTGYGLLGHLMEMCNASGVSALVEFDKLDFLDGVEELAKNGIVPGGTKRNLAYVSQATGFGTSLPRHRRLMTVDAQTSGGLLISMPSDRAEPFVENFNDQSPIHASMIGEVRKRKDPVVSVV